MDKQPELTPQEAQALATAAADAMWQRDATAHALGMERIEVTPGKATLRMRVRPDMANGHHIAHGGMIFTLADTAFAYACNSYNLNTVASACHIDFLAPAREGDLPLAGGGSYTRTESIELPLRSTLAAGAYYLIVVTDSGGAFVLASRERADDILAERNQTIVTAESCTGGMVGEMITAVPGSSEYYTGGVVAYANQVKMQLLGVSEQMLVEHGAVSEPVAMQMAVGARERFNTTWAVSITGVAGPGGGTEAKPVGLVYVGLAGKDCRLVERLMIPGLRDIVRLRASLNALNILRMRLIG